MHMTPIELRARREALGLSQTEFAKILSTSQHTVSDWERGHREIPLGLRGELGQAEYYVDVATEAALTTLQQAAKEHAPENLHLLVYEDDAAYGKAHPDADGTSAVLHRVAMARAAYAFEQESDTRVPLIVDPEEAHQERPWWFVYESQANRQFNMRNGIDFDEWLTVLGSVIGREMERLGNDAVNRECAELFKESHDEVRNMWHLGVDPGDAAWAFLEHAGVRITDPEAE